MNAFEFVEATGLVKKERPVTFKVAIDEYKKKLITKKSVYA
jgi:hypothetical protein